MYTITDYGQMIADRLRMGAYADALRRLVGPTSVVVDVGTGTGVFALIAAQLGARQVYAIEPSDVIELARKFARSNGVANRIKFIQGHSQDVDLPERADIIVSDLRGALPLFADHLTAIIDARRRFLAAGGTLIPENDTLWAALVNAEQLYRVYADPWQSQQLDIDLSSGLEMALNQHRKAQITSRQLCVQPQRWAELDYGRISTPNAAANLRWTLQQDNEVHGFTVWFDSSLAGDIGLSNAPGNPELIYGQTFFPWLEPVKLRREDTVDVLLEARLVGGEYVWRWDSIIRDAQGQARAEFKQSTFFAMPLSPTRLRGQAEDFVVTLNAGGHVVAQALRLMAGDKSLVQIAHDLHAQFPKRFRDSVQALDYVRKLSERYGA